MPRIFRIEIEAPMADPDRWAVDELGMEVLASLQGWEWGDFWHDGVVLTAEWVEPERQDVIPQGFTADTYAELFE